MNTAAERLGSEWLSWLGERPLIQALVIVLAAALAAKVVDWILTKAISVWAKRSHTDLDDRLIALLHRPLFISVFLVGIWLAASRLGLSPPMQTLVLRLLKTLALVLWATFAVRAAAILLAAASRLEKRSQLIEPRTLALADNTAKLLIFGGAAYLFFLSWGIDVGGWLVSAGVLGLVLGLAAKDSLANLFAGMFILADAPYKVGDFINLDSGERGEVTQIGLRSTRLLTRDDIEITVPNSAIAAAKIVNESGGPWEKERVRLKVGVAYGSDIDRVREALLTTASENPDVVDQPEPRVRMRGFGESALDFELLAWITEPVLRGRVLDALYEDVYKRFQRDGIEIPFPQRDINMRRS
ncbi:MAG: mechanosensitive ion channel family protein [Acidobacteriota bacterium]|nr:mechanosensitive ion channel family protein [Acidobacteriota bacterium]